MTDVPKHRASTGSRSADTHVIGADGKARNVDQEAREARAAAPQASRASIPANPSVEAVQRPASAPPPQRGK